MEKFAIGVALGMVGGALLVTNNYKMRMLVKKSQDEVQAKFDEMLDEKLQSMEETAQKVKDEVSSTVEETKKKLKKN